ncbi:coiled-coil-helix-coiled-coil-helix domain-containing protein 2 [Sigmodon hispidus]
MPRGSQSRSSPVAPPASRAPQMRAAPRQAPAAQPPAAAAPSAWGTPWAMLSTGAFSGGGNAEPAKPDITYQEPQGAQLLDQQSHGPCSLEIRQFLECAQNQSDVKLCVGFNEVLRQCGIANGLI